MKTSQFFTFYHADFLLGTAAFSCEQVGAYIRLLCYQWEQGSLPNCAKTLATLAQTSAENISTILCKFQESSDGQIKNRKMEEVRKSLNTYRKSRSQNGKKGGRPKKHMVSTCLPYEKHSESFLTPTPIPFPTPTPSTPKPPPTPKGVDGFDLFWKAYPNRKCVAGARKSWAKAIRLASPETIIAAVERQKMSPGWMKQNGDFIPLPTTWLNNERWKDELSIADPAKPDYRNYL